MGYIVSFLTGALGFAIYDKQNEKQTGLNLTAAAVQAIIVFYLYKKFFKK